LTKGGRPFDVLSARDGQDSIAVDAEIDCWPVFPSTPIDRFRFFAKGRPNETFLDLFAGSDWKGWEEVKSIVCWDGESFIIPLPMSGIEEVFLFLLNGKPLFALSGGFLTEDEEGSGT
jgi:hypothetical protein